MVYLDLRDLWRDRREKVFKSSGHPGDYEKFVGRPAEERVDLPAVHYRWAAVVGSRRREVRLKFGDPKK